MRRPLPDGSRRADGLDRRRATPTFRFFDVRSPRVKKRGAGLCKRRIKRIILNSGSQV